MFEPHCPDHETGCVQHVVRGQKEMREKTHNGEWDEGEEVMLRIGEVKSEFLTEMVANSIQF